MQQEAGTSSNSNKQAFKFALNKRSRSFQDANGMFDVSAFEKEKEMVAQKYAHSNARYRRNLEEGKVKVRSRQKRNTEEEPVYDMAKREYIYTSSSRNHHQQHSKRQSSGTTGSVELIDCECTHLPLIREVKEGE